MEKVQITLSGKMLKVPLILVAQREVIFNPCLKKSQKPIFQYLNLEDGHQAEWCEVAEFLSHGDYWMPNTGEFPSVAKESSLSQILEPIVPIKYALSSKATTGIEVRAERRNKELPKILSYVLDQQKQWIDEVREAHPDALVIMHHCDNSIFDARGNGDGKISCTLTGDHQNRITDYTAITVHTAGFNGWRSVTGSIEYADGCCPTMQRVMPPYICYAIEGNASRPSHGGVGIRDDGEPMYTLNSVDRHGVAVAVGVVHPVITIDRAAFSQGINAKYDFMIGEEVCSTLMAAGPSAVCQFSNAIQVTAIVRRLTPVECERLQGFPDNWTVLGHDGKQISDSARYKVLGNSIAVPCLDMLFENIVELRCI